jgi:hypothetical protein
MSGTPGVTVRLRVWAAWEICRIELAGVDWCDVAGVVELPLYSAKRRRVVEGERQRRGTLGFRRGYRCGARSEGVYGKGLKSLGISLSDHPVLINRRPFDRDDDGSGHRRGVIRAGHCRTGLTVIRRRGRCGCGRQE